MVTLGRQAHVMHGTIPGRWLQGVTPSRREYLRTPYTSRQEHVDNTMHVVRKIPNDMARKSSKPRCAMKDILHTGIFRDHIGYMPNGNTIRSRIAETEPTLLAWHTCGNEAVHGQMEKAQKPKS